MSRKNRRHRVPLTPIPPPEGAERPQETEKPVSVSEVGPSPAECPGGLPGRSFSKLGLSQLLGVDRATVDRWVREGCPVVREGLGRGAGNEWRFDAAAVFAWHREWQAKTLVQTSENAGEDADADIKLLKLA